MGRQVNMAFPAGLLRLHGKAALVTGGYGGIRESVSRGLAAVGAKVVIAGRNFEKASAAAAAIRELGYARSGRGDMAIVCHGAGEQTERSTRPGAPRSVSGAAIPETLDTERQWQATAIGDRGAGG
jgi:NAD(P)-dependent dehydrogenase (short-subunit alcohol dehydrogenase family)